MRRLRMKIEVRCPKCHWVTYLTLIKALNCLFFSQFSRLYFTSINTFHANLIVPISIFFYSIFIKLLFQSTDFIWQINSFFFILLLLMSGLIFLKVVSTSFFLCSVFLKLCEDDDNIRVWLSIFAIEASPSVLILRFWHAGCHRHIMENISKVSECSSARSTESLRLLNICGGSGDRFSHEDLVTFIFVKSCRGMNRETGQKYFLLHN